jgi:hypothetical protein
MPLPPHVREAADLMTTDLEIRRGFSEQALAKTEKAEPYVERALTLWNDLKATRSIDEFFSRAGSLGNVISAAGFSEKARKKFTPEELAEQAKRLVQHISQKYHDDWRTHVLFRYLLTKGDALGGEMRNWVGAAAQKVLADAILSALKRARVKSAVSADQEKIKLIVWGHRRMLFDRKCPLVRKSIDVILLDSAAIDARREPTDEREWDRALLCEPNCYLACGELKGGIDPAGADEHWKTAGSAIGRIHQKVPKVKLFFVGRAIEESMATEIFQHLKENSLHCAANLTKPEQLGDLANWLISL